MLLEQRVPSGKKEDVEITLFGHRLADIPLIDPAADRLHDALFAQLDHRLVSAGHELLNSFVRSGFAAVGGRAQIVGKKNVHPPDPEPFQAFLERTQDAVVGIVEYFFHVRHLEPPPDAASFA